MTIPRCVKHLSRAYMLHARSTVEFVWTRPQWSAIHPFIHTSMLNPCSVLPLPLLLRRATHTTAQSVQARGWPLQETQRPSRARVEVVFSRQAFDPWPTCTARSGGQRCTEELSVESCTEEGVDQLRLGKAVGCGSSSRVVQRQKTDYGGL